MQIEAVKIRRLYLEVADQLSGLISEGQIKAGERLPSERELATKFGVSRPTIREAMIALEIAGAVEIRTGSGIYAAKQVPVLQVNDAGPGPYEILEARRIIECEAASLASARITDKQLEDLSEALTSMEIENQQGLSEKADRKFHTIIAQASQNSAISSMVIWLWELRDNSQLSTIFHQRARDRAIHPSINDHRLILSALRQRDPTAAHNAMHQHFTGAIEAVTLMLDEKEIARNSAAQ